MYFVYIIRSLKFEKYYTGSTENLDRRLKNHNSGKVRSTKVYKPWKIAYTELYESKSEALKREKQIKSYKGGNAFRALIS